MDDLDEERRRTYWLYAMTIIPVIILTVTFVVKKKLGCGLNSVQLKKHSAPGRARYYLDSATYQIMGLESGSQQYVSENPCINLYRYRDFRSDFEAQTDSHDQQRRKKLSLLQSRFMSAYKVLSAISDSGSQASSVDQPQQEHGKWLSVRKNFDRIDRRNSSSQENLQRNDKEEQQQLTRSNNSSEEIVNHKDLVYANLDFSHVQLTDCRSPATMEPVKYAVIDFQESAKKTKY